MKTKLLKIALISFIIAIVLCAVAYFFFHHVTDDGITWEKQEEAGKPFVTDMIGQLAVLFLFASAMCLIFAIVFVEKQQK